MANGYLAGGVVILSADGSGLPVVETAPPECPVGYRLKSGWDGAGTSITQTWELVPEEGTAQEAALALSRMQFQSLPDEAAYLVRALADQYVDGMTCYGPDNDAGMPVTRVNYYGDLYRFIGSGVQVMQPGWNPVAAPSLWARILPGQEGSGDEGPQPWEQPDSTNGYSEGDRVTHNGRLWESLVDDNVDEPGTDNGFRWKDLGPAEGVDA
ncbi:hypothetical protein B5G20_04905 [Collinsella sp. An7]|uniref:hypothetical protein n=1 Tax=Collinsella sp. An7 TaxID=1965651 RepID=UPI000B556454|nr:hypothetical protein [Collinsella sp. An7]OUN47307.1 hypothetical protein B5G20_04905 [Collinsella sp. An7]